MSSEKRELIQHFGPVPDEKETVGFNVVYPTDISEQTRAKYFTDNLHQAIAALEVKSPDLESLKATAHEMDPRLKAGMPVVEKLLEEIANLAGEQTDQELSLDVFMIMAQDFERAFGKETAGQMTHHSQDIFIKDSPVFLPTTILGVILHELIHKNIDFFPLLFKDKPIYGNQPNMFKGTNFTFFSGRVGTHVKHIKKNSRTGEILGFDDRGEILNEVGNFVWEKELIKRLIQDPSFRKENPENCAIIMQLLQKKGKETYPDETSRGSVALQISGENMALAGKKYVLTAHSIMWQIYDELSDVFGVVDGKDLKAWLTLTKFDPQKQIVIQKRFDSVFGKTLFKQLKQRQYTVDEITFFLADLQAQKPQLQPARRRSFAQWNHLLNFVRQSLPFS